MALALIAMALQLQTASLPAPPAEAQGLSAAESSRIAGQARRAQADFERTRRANLPWEWGSDGRCEVRLGRFCWWYDDATPPLPPENDATVRARRSLVATLDSLARLVPGDRWLAGMRVHYRVDAGDLAAADSAARRCDTDGWWCDALAAYAAHARGDAARADSLVSASLRGMDDSTRCAWSDLRVLLPGDARGRYESVPCAERSSIERRYWLLGQPRLASVGNEWRTEFFVRRLQSWLAARSRTPHNLSWGADAEELLLRYGWPAAWGRVRPPATALPGADVSIIGHDPSPSFAFTPHEELLDPLAEGDDDAWDLRARLAESRYAPPGVRRVARLSAQLARFRRGDSVLLAAAFATDDDSLRAPVARLAAALDDGTVVVGAADSVRRGTATLLLRDAPRLAGVEIADSASGSLVRGRVAYAPFAPPSRVTLSDLLLHRPDSVTSPALAAALDRAIPGSRVTRDRPVALYWETYGLAEAGEAAEIVVTVERVDRSWFRTARQAVGLSDADAPVRIRWTDARPAGNGIATHAISLDLANLPEGRYRITLSLTAGDGSAALATRLIELRDR